jgi:hypothetical protein
MLAWTLKMKPLTRGSSGPDRRGPRRLRARRRRVVRQAVQQLLDAEQLQRAAEEDRRQVTIAEGLKVEARIGFGREAAFLASCAAASRG